MKVNVDWEKRNKEAVKILQDILKIQSDRKNEILVAKYFQSVLAKEGIPSRIYSPPGKPDHANLVAVLETTNKTQEKGLILANHIDVVEADPKEWDVPPYSGIIKDGRIWGRGAIDMKGMAVMQLMAFLELKRSKIPLERKVMFLALADEESGSKYGAAYMISEYKNLFDGYGWMIGEGGIAVKGAITGNSTVFNIQYAEKGNIWLKLIAKGQSGHGSTPPNEYASLNLLNFYKEVLSIDTSIKITDETKGFFYQLGSVSNFPNSFFLKNASNPIFKPLLSGPIRKNRHLTAMTTNTKSITGLHTNEETTGYNVLNGEVVGKLDIRVLPGTDTKEYIEDIRKIAKKYSIEVVIFDEISPDSSPIDSVLFQTLANVSVSKVENSVAAPFLSPGKTDNSRFRRIGIDAYGLIPAVLEPTDLDSMHGKNENIKIENLKLGSTILFETILQLNGL
ncbi:M20/M25/M40 family metallo-hydrolase [Leptospira idonii]|uniref:M20/M25/M40 family metallo-hydrolase n=1 Tax=Leptospira idonii TaxID=1193500 RepID=UPI001FE45A79|nr:M20/M25/M40 family metallo-hydrolase [Leptospira idonii]